MRWIFPSTWISRCLLVALLAATGTFPANTAERIQAGAFSQAGIGQALPLNWQPLTFKRIERQTDYSLVQEGGAVVVKAISAQSASGLISKISIDPKQYPRLQWSWKVSHTLQGGDVSRKDGDDYPARLYITFAFDPASAGYLERLKYQAAQLLFGVEVPYRAISYIWGSNSAADTMVANPYTDNVMMFVLQSGDAQLQQWVAETRNVYEDYKTAFGEEPPMINAVAIMTDTDNTGESAVAWYGDIEFRGE
jgi:hypothetical protein